MIPQLFSAEQKFHLRRHKGGAGKAVVQQVQATPTPTPPRQGDAARNIAPASIARQRNNATRGRAGSILAPRGTLDDQISSLLGS